MPETLKEIQTACWREQIIGVWEKSQLAWILTRLLVWFLDKIEELNIADNTYVFYSADHGTPGRTSNAPLTLGKGSVWEGGLRVPLLVRGPGIKANTFAYARTMGIDLLPTIAELSQGDSSLPEDVEGGSLVPILRNRGQGEVKRSREELVFSFSTLRYGSRRDLHRQSCWAITS